MHEVAEKQGRTERIHRDIILVRSGHRDDQRRCARCRILSEIEISQQLGDRRTAQTNIGSMYYARICTLVRIAAN